MRIPIILSALMLAAPAAAQDGRRAPDETIHLVAAVGPDVHLRGAAEAVRPGVARIWWWHFWEAEPGEDWDGAAYQIDVDCASGRRSRVRSEFYRALRFDYAEAGDGVPSAPPQPDTPAADLVRGACEDWRDGEPFGSPGEAYEVAQEYFALRRSEP